MATHPNDGQVGTAPRSVLTDDDPKATGRALRRLEDYVRRLEERIAAAELRLKAGGL